MTSIDVTSALAALCIACAVGIAARLLTPDHAARTAQRAAWRSWRFTGQPVPGWGPEWAWSNPSPAAPAHQAEPAPAVVVCLACRLEGRALSSAAEAEFLAGIHNELHHGARPIAAPHPLDSTDTGGAA